MSHPASTVLVIGIASSLSLLGAFLVYLAVRYAPIIARVFEESPFFLPLRLPAEPGGENLRFRTEDGLELVGTYYRRTTEARVGVLVFCHEYLSNRWSFKPYINSLRDLGYDVLTFDFRNHGESQVDPTYKPLQWVTDYEVRDLRAALAYLRTRPDHDTAGFGLFGMSRGGGTALVMASMEPSVWGVITDGAFPVRGTILSYMKRWTEIYVSNAYLARHLPRWVYEFVAWSGRVRSERRLNCRFPNIEEAVSRLAPRPWLMIHGEKDAYIGPAIARALFAEASEPKELWIVPKAKHNRCRETQPQVYADRVVAFFRRYAPRRELPPSEPADDNRAADRVEIQATSDPTDRALSASAFAGGLASPVPG